MCFFPCGAVSFKGGGSVRHLVKKKKKYLRFDYVITILYHVLLYKKNLNKCALPRNIHSLDLLNKRADSGFPIIVRIYRFNCPFT